MANDKEKLLSKLPIHFYLSQLKSNVFSLLQEKQFETIENISCRIDESIIFEQNPPAGVTLFGGKW